MSNLAQAKEALEQNTNLEAIINPQPKKRVKLPLQRDVNLVQSILDKKLEDREAKFKEKKLREAQDKYKSEIDEIHEKAVNLRKDAERIAKLVESDSGNNVVAKFLHNNYGNGYWSDLPESLDEAKKEDLFEIDGGKFTEVENLKKEIEEYVLNVKIGLAPLADVKALLEKIDQALI